MIQWYGMVMQTPSKTWSSRGKDKRLAHSIPCENFGMGNESREWFFIVHPPYFNCEQCAQIIKRNVSISLHSISAIRWHYCTTRTASFHFEQHYRHSGLTFFHYVSFRSLCVVLLSIFFLCIISFIVASIASTHYIGTLSSKSNTSNKVSCRVKRFRDNLTRWREDGNNILWITIIFCDLTLTQRLPQPCTLFSPCVRYKPDVILHT